MTTVAVWTLIALLVLVILASARLVQQARDEAARVVGQAQDAIREAQERAEANASAASEWQQKAIAAMEDDERARFERALELLAWEHVLVQHGQRPAEYLAEIEMWRRKLMERAMTRGRKPNA